MTKAIAVPMDVAPMSIHLSRLVIGVTAFLTVVDLFATQALLPTLTTHYGVSPREMGIAVNASTFGMAASGLAVGFFSRRIDRRLGILLSLLILAIPTTLLAIAPDLTTFTILRVIQGLCMAAAFTLTLAYLGENLSAKDTAGAFAAYITGNVASNLIGRFIAAGVADHFGLAVNFYAFALLNLAGAALVYVTIKRTRPMQQGETMALSPFATLATHLRNPALAAAFAIGFCILFAFIGTFTYVNFVLVREPLSVGMMTLGAIYFVFLPSIFTTPLAGNVVALVGTRRAMWSGLLVAAIGLPLLLAGELASVLAGMVLVAIGTFFAQATATGFVSRAATTDRGSASGIYLASYFLGGLIGTAVLGQLFDRIGWTACVIGVAVILAVAALLTLRLRIPTEA
jgi:MFS transporter, YNFM family, putative membrane transport protein